MMATFFNETFLNIWSQMWLEPQQANQKKTMMVKTAVDYILCCTFAVYVQ